LTEDRILSLHPQGKKGVNIELSKYLTLREVVLECLSTREMTATEIFRCSEERLSGDFEGSVGWYAESVKLDLEARGIIARSKKGGKVVYGIIP